MLISAGTDPAAAAAAAAYVRWLAAYARWHAEYERWNAERERRAGACSLIPREAAPKSEVLWQGLRTALPAA